MGRKNLVIISEDVDGEALATLVLNVLDIKSKVEIVFHGLNPEDPESKFNAFKEIVAGSGTAGGLNYEIGSGGRVPGSSSSFRWIKWSSRSKGPEKTGS